MRPTGEALPRPAFRSSRRKDVPFREGRGIAEDVRQIMGDFLYEPADA
jgi:hypothetical protein